MPRDIGAAIEAAMQARFKAMLWECPDCGFEMPVRHRSTSKEEPCPACENVALRANLTLLRAELNLVKTELNKWRVV